MRALPECPDHRLIFLLSGIRRWQLPGRRELPARCRATDALCESPAPIRLSYETARWLRRIDRQPHKPALALH